MEGCSDIRIIYTESIVASYYTFKNLLLSRWLFCSMQL